MFSFYFAFVSIIQLTVCDLYREYSLVDFDDLLRHLTYVGLYEFDVYRPGVTHPFLTHSFIIV